MIRNRHRIGRYLMVDDESGLIRYDDQMVKRWDGAFVRKSQNEHRNPQEFVRALKDPQALRNVRPLQPIARGCDTSFSLYVGNTNIPTPGGAASHLFDVGIGEAEVGCSLVVR